ncbi:AAA family ATPase [Streptococcus suis]|nr:AAA family ATPase [Streptococcus suis]MCK3999023.1 AAA family ATPase [Streptococcus suis]
MLIEIVCDKFKKEKVTFKPGLNVIEGTDDGDNSIGKSTMLLIIDFVFGGETYSQKSEIFKNIDNHDVKFKFEFEGDIFYFSRNFLKSSEVWSCDKDYKKISSMTLDQYNKFLLEKYNIKEKGASFRNLVSRFIRIYGKGGLDETAPLESYKGEANGKAIKPLLQLFEKYHIISDLQDNLDEITTEIAVYNNAQKHSLVSKITATAYKTNLKAIDKIEGELQTISDSLESNIIDIQEVISNRAVEINIKLSNLRRQAARLEVRLKKIDADLQYKFSYTEKNWGLLTTFFPEINLKKIEEIEEFHSSLSKIFRGELRKEKKELDLELSELRLEINKLDGELKNIITEPKISTVLLDSYSELVVEKNRMLSENRVYLDLKKLTEQKKKSQERKDKEYSILLNKIEKDINNQLEIYNNYIYSEDYHAPHLSLEANKIQYFIPQDSEAGTAGKALIILDLAILELTNLPVLVHDSNVFKQLSRNATEKIIELYQSFSKQIFIAFDRQETFSEDAINILKKNTVLSLSDGNELFGWSWSKKIRD